MDVKERYRRNLKDALNATIDELVDSGVVTDYSQRAQELIAAAAADAIDENVRLNRRFGSFYTTARVAEVLGGISRQAVSERSRNHRLLRVVTEDGVPVYPEFQFNVRTGRVRRELIPLFKILLSTGVDPWTVVYWLTAELPEFENRTAVDVAGDGGEAVAVLEAMALEDAGRWRSAGYGQRAS